MRSLWRPVATPPSCLVVLPMLHSFWLAIDKKFVQWKLLFHGGSEIERGWCRTMEDDDIEYEITFPSPVAGETGLFGSSRKEPVVIILGWMGCREKHLMKYGQIYDERGWVFTLFATVFSTQTDHSCFSSLLNHWLTALSNITLIVNRFCNRAYMQHYMHTVCNSLNRLQIKILPILCYSVIILPHMVADSFV